MKKIYALSFLLFPLYANSQNVGVGTASPGSKLSVNGNLSIGTNYSILSSNLPTNGLIIEGNTGIGISNPGVKLDVSGDVRTDSYFRITSGTGKGIRFWDSDSYKISMGNSAEYQYGPVTDYSIKFSMNNTATRGWTWGSTGSTPVAALTSLGNMQLAGNLGLGITPAYKLDVSGTTRISSLGGAGNALVTTDNGGVLSKTAFTGNSTDVLTGTGSFASLSSLTGDYWTLSGSLLYPKQTTWNVGVGNNNPGVRLDVGATNSNIAEVIRVTSNNNFAGLELRGDQGNVTGEPGGAYVTLSQDGESVKGILGVVNIAGQDGSGNALSKTLANSVVLANKYAGALHLGANNSVDFTIASNGTVGIGTTTPSGGALIIRDTVTANTGYFGIDNRMSVTDIALTANRIQYGIYNYLLNSSTLSTNTSGSQLTQYGAYNYWHQNDATANVRAGYGSHNYAFNQAGNVFSAIYGAYNYGRNREVVPAIYGSFNYSLQDLAGATSTNSYANFSQAQTTEGTTTSGFGAYNYTLASTNGIITTARGSYNRVRAQDNGIITTAYGVDASLEVAGAGAITTGYLFRGNMSTTIGTRYGLYLTNENINYLSGSLGLGVTSPAEKLDVSGNMKFSGALMPAGNAGTNGQILVSKGPGAAPQWQTAGDVIKAYGASATRTSITSSTYTDVGGLSITFTLTETSLVFINTCGALETTAGTDGASGTRVAVYNGTTIVTQQTVDIVNNYYYSQNINPWGISTYQLLSPGTYTFKVKAMKYTGSNFYAGGSYTSLTNEGTMTILVIPQ